MDFPIKCTLFYNSKNKKAGGTLTIEYPAFKLIQSRKKEIFLDLLQKLFILSASKKSVVIV